MKIALIIAGIAGIVGAVLVAADQVGKYCEDVNPGAPEDYPRHDAGQDF